MSNSSHYISFQGTLNRTKIIKTDEPLLVFAEIINQAGQPVHCLVVHQPLTFLMDVVEGDTLSVYGRYNDHHQFIISKYSSPRIYQNRTQIDYPHHLKYPRRKKD